MKKAVRIFTAVLAVFLMGMTAMAQSVEDIKRLVKEIQLDEAYFSGIGNGNTELLAKNKALVDLQLIVSQYLNEIGAASGDYMKLLEPHIKELTYNDGNKFTALLYIEAEKVDNPQTLANVAPLPEPEPDPEPFPDPAPVPPPPPAPTPYEQWNTAGADVIEILSAQESWSELKSIMTNMVDRGDIMQTGAVTSYAEVPEDAFCILFDEIGISLGVFSPKKNSSGINHKTGLKDSPANHSDYKFIVWYR